MTEQTTRPSGLVGSLRSLLANGLSLFATRGELAALELADARDRAFRWLSLALTAAVLLLAALMTLSLWVAALFWEGPRALALGLLALAYAVTGAVIVAVVRRELAATPPLLANTRAELVKDRDALRGHLDRANNDEPG
jgi:uncharacterized membrane protein YqjE